MIQWTADTPPKWPGHVKGVCLEPDTWLELVTTAASGYSRRGHYCQPTQCWTDEMRAYMHCCIAAHPYFTAKPHQTLTNRIPGLGSQHIKHYMLVCLNSDTNCLYPLYCP